MGNNKKQIKELAEDQELQEEKDKAGALPGFESLLNLAKTPDSIKTILGKMNVVGLDFKSALEQVDRVIMQELKINPESAAAKDLRKYQTKIDELLNEMEKNEVTYDGARQNFEKAVIAKVAEEEEINVADGAVSLNWFVDDKMSDGKFALVQDLGIKEEAGEKITLTDAKTGEVYEEKKFFDPANSYKQESKQYFLETEQVKEIFNKLEPAVKKSILDGLNDQIKENERYSKNLKDNKEIEEEDLVREKIKKQLKALE